LKDQAVVRLRQAIVNGRIPPGSKLTEREIASLLGVSRMPARDALMALEQQGLVTSKPGGRYVIQLSPVEVRQLYQVRLVLEKLAVSSVIEQFNESSATALQDGFTALANAIRDNDSERYIASDLAMHELIWELAGNPYLYQMLHSIVGPIFLVIASQTRVNEDWQETFALHHTLLEAMLARDTPLALKVMGDHMRHSQELALAILEEGDNI
jgi:DNA-binding GntR family transcriptional regulator